MKPVSISDFTILAKRSAFLAGEKILEVYNSTDLGITFKEDQSPLTLADQAAHVEIANCLSDSGLPILSEEGAEVPFETRKYWGYYWLVDPLDGTKEFVKRNGEFTVNIALIHHGRPLMGVVYVPVLQELYWGLKGGGAWKQFKDADPISISVKNIEPIQTIVSSRSHSNQETEKFLKQYPDAEIINMGSSLKFLLIADGRAQLCPRFGPTMEWDTAAAHAIVNAAGGSVRDYNTGNELYYNKEDLLNPWFVVKSER